eukprot:c8224_g1_i1.p1 GENE.c8224_g1_i1~~c8224_g1_i1.p1  ORF type:complete len:180 (+),score=30.68 c8224_g1_i1:85-624(+)
MTQAGGSFGGFDRSALGPVFGGYELADDDDVLVLPEGYGMQRSMLDRLWSNTGITFATGAGLGGTYGFVEGLRQSGRTTFKLRMNAVINSTTSRARKVGNTVGVLAIMYTLIQESGTTLLPDPDMQNIVTIGAGTATGILFNCTTGIRHTALGAVLGTSLMGLAVLGKRFWEGKGERRL